MEQAKRQRIQDMDLTECRIEPKYPKYQTWGARSTTFKDFWPNNLPIHVDTLILNGLFYTRKSDRVVCYYCGLGLKNLTNADNVLKIYIALNSTCPFLHMSHSKKVILEFADSTSNIVDPNKHFVVTESDFSILDPQTSSLNANEWQLKLAPMARYYDSKVKALTLRYESLIKTLEDKNKELQSSNNELDKLVTCPICMDRKKNTMTVCGHGFCTTCLRSTLDNKQPCPSCRVPIDITKLRIFYL